MTETITCPNCQMDLRLPDAHFEQQVRCPSCRALFSADSRRVAALLGDAAFASGSAYSFGPDHPKYSRPLAKRPFWGPWRISGVVVGFVALLIGCCVWFAWSDRPPQRYAPGRDTVRSFGDGRFELVDCDNTLTLMDLETQHNCVWDVVKWNTKGHYVYTIDRQGSYGLFDYSTGAFFGYPNLDAVPYEHRSMMRSLK